jgi:hypothetical protein
MALKAAVWVPGTIVMPDRSRFDVPGSQYHQEFHLYRFGWGARAQGVPVTQTTVEWDPDLGHHLAKTELATDQVCWFNFPLATPVIVDDKRPHLVKVFALYRTTGAKVTQVHLYDGPQRVLKIAIPAAGLTGDHLQAPDASNSWVVHPPLTIRMGLGITVGVEFSYSGDVDTGVGPGTIDFGPVGADFAPA